MSNEAATPRGTAIDYDARIIRRYGETHDYNLDPREDRALRFWLHAASAECAERHFQARIFDHVGARASVTVDAALSAFDETIDRLRTWPQSAPAGLEQTLQRLRAEAAALLEVIRT